MKRRAAISPSMMCADITQTGHFLQIMQEEGIEYLHIDVMDGRFVPNFTLGTDYCKMLRAHTDIPLDIHLMVEDPEEKLGWFDIAEGDIVSVHAESTRHLQKALSCVAASGGIPFVALNPATPLTALDYVLDDIGGVLVMTVNPGFAGQKMVPACLDKIRDVREYLDARDRQDALIEVDGNVSFENAVKMRRAGADILVAGTSSIFHKDYTLAEGIRKLREVVEM